MAGSDNALQIPGGPLHVLLTDEIRTCAVVQHGVSRSRLAAIGGFDPLYRSAGDDVDCVGDCKKRLDHRVRGAAMVCTIGGNHPRYWRQQIVMERRGASRTQMAGTLFALVI